MVTIETGEAFLFFGAAAFGLIAGIAGNWFVTSFFRWVDDKSAMNSFYFVVGIIMVVFFIVYLLDHFFKYSYLP